MWRPLYLNVGFRIIPKQYRGKWLRNELQKSGPVYVKFGQFMSNREDIFGKDLAEDLGTLRDRVPPEPFESLSFTQGEIDEVPIASASISQVHKGRIAGKNVVFKIKRPRILEKIQKDLAIIERFISIVDKSLIDSVFNDFKENLQKEIDFRAEIQNMQKFSEMYIDSTMVRIPKVFPEFSTDDVIVMEHMPSSGILDTGDSETAHKVMTMFLQQILFEGEVHGDLHAGNIGLSNGKLVLYDFGNVISIPGSYQVYMRELFRAIQDQNEDEIFSCMVQMGMVINDEKETRLFIRGCLRYLNTVDVKAFSTTQFTTKIPVQFDRTTFQIIRTTGLVEGTCKKIDPDFNYQRAILLCIELMALGY
jgi:predicted unusual protein kinase regulating ubiquinone biosynthesis (AarF/ABC1/UbiB family)